MEDQDRKEQMKAIEARIAKARGLTAPKPRADEHYSQAQLAWRMVIELVAGLGIGFGIGYGLDVLFGTLPIFMVLFTMLGLAAGVKTMLRSANEIQAKLLAELAEEIDTPDTGRTGTARDPGDENKGA
ncbi:AtpZ/AtpI family protein [Sulfitobacter sp. HNIBRBA3233]